MQPIMVEIDELVPPVRGWTNGEIWNGWQCPCFDRGAVELIMTAIRNGNGEAWWEADAPCFRFEDDRGDDSTTDKFPPVDTEHGRLWPVGASCWTWDVAVPEVGQRVRLRREVDRYPDALVEARATGTVRKVEEEPAVVGVEMDRPVAGLEGWDNQLRWAELHTERPTLRGVLEAFWADVEPADG